MKSNIKSISILGSTGSIGRQTLDIVQGHKERLKVVALAAGSSNLNLLAEQIELFQPNLVGVPNESDAQELKSLLSSSTKCPQLVIGEEGLDLVASDSQSDTVVTGLVGFLGLKPTAAAIRKGKTIALANKETLVVAGSIIMSMAREYNAQIIPVDSEHSAIFQSLQGNNGTQDRSVIRQILLTGSGGPFRDWPIDKIHNATVDDALKHPNWAMGPKITIDSATMMNKGLEIIEARWLFDIDPAHIKVIIHPQSILHSAIEFIDGSIIGQLGLPDMRLPIHYALFYPDRVKSERVPPLNLTDLAKLTFEEPDHARFPCLTIAKMVAKEENTMPCVLNAANEIVVGAFLKGHVKFYEISQFIELVLNKHKPVGKPLMEDILEADRWARSEANNLIKDGYAIK